MRRRRPLPAALLLAGALTLALVGCSSDDDGDGGGSGQTDPTSTTIEGCVQTVEGCIDPDSIEPGECIPSDENTDDCVNYTEPTTTTGQ